MAESEIPAGALVDAIDDALLVVDGDDTIVECNDAFEAIVDTDRDTVSEPVASALSAHPALRDCIENRDESVVAVGTDGGTQYFEVAISPVEDSVDQEFELIVLHDVTAQREQQRALEQENEQLDQFASFISHDLRNPLDVAMGRTTVIAELVDDPQIEDHIDEIDRAHSRMLRIIEDVLTLARDGQSINEKTEVEVGAVASDAWSHVETDNADLVVEDDQFLLADPERLGQVFENLFRNSVEHGSDADIVTVTVGGLAEKDGFYVADNGQGIDPDIRERVLEAGFTGDEDGTGLGLGIVSNIAGAHEWDVDVTESKSGGARFEFTGVDVVPGVNQ
jgi:signal transduction histidine kinase